MKNLLSPRGVMSALVLFGVLIGAIIGLSGAQHAQNQGARTERSPTSYDKDGNLISTETDFDAQNRPVEKREIKNGKVRKRTRLTYLKGFTKPNTSTTEYGPDGKTPVSIKNDDVDKDGNPTSSVTTTYDANGSETGGSKRERDPTTGKDRCYKWDPKKGVHEEVACPPEIAQSSEPPAQPSPRPRLNITDRDTRNNTCTCGPGNVPCPCPSPSPTPAPGNSQNARAETIGGLRIVTFGSPQGQIHIYLPEDMMAGDTISGTFVVEPESRKQSTEDSDVFRRQLYIDFLHREKPPGAENWISSFSVPERNASAQESTKFVIDLNYNILPIILKDADGKELGSFTLPIVVPQPAPPQSSSLRNTGSRSFQLPSLGQAGRTSLIAGPFDGNSSNTLLKWCINLTPACEQNPSTGGVIAPLAESPRQVVFRAPINVTGPVQIQLNEGKTETKGQLRNIRVNLSAPKTNLLKGEHTTLTVEVEGLQGITRPVPLTLDSQGVITMDGGMYQPLVIQPSQVGTAGRYTTTRGITGVQAGAWTSTATVVTQPFDVILRDPEPPQTILINSYTGEYVFCGSNFKLNGVGEVKRSGNIVTLTDSKSDRTVQGRFDTTRQLYFPVTSLRSPGIPASIQATVTDSVPPKKTVYFSPPTRVFAPVQDVSAFATCP